MNRETGGGPEQPEKLDKKEKELNEPNSPASISFGKAVQFMARSLAYGEGIVNPEARHYAMADKNAESYSEEEIEMYAQVQKLREVVGGKNLQDFFDLIYAYSSESSKEIKKITPEEEISRRYNKAINSLNFGKDVHIEKEALTNAFYHSAAVYAQDVSPIIRKHFDHLKEGLTLPDDIESREPIESAINYIIEYYYQLSLDEAKHIYLGKLLGKVYHEEK